MFSLLLPFLHYFSISHLTFTPSCLLIDCVFLSDLFSSFSFFYSALSLLLIPCCPSYLHSIFLLFFACFIFCRLTFFFSSVLSFLCLAFRYLSLLLFPFRFRNISCYLTSTSYLLCLSLYRYSCFSRLLTSLSLSYCLHFLSFFILPFYFLYLSFSFYCFVRCFKSCSPLGLLSSLSFFLRIITAFSYPINIAVLRVSSYLSFPSFFMLVLPSARYCRLLFSYCFFSLSLFFPLSFLPNYCLLLAALSIFFSFTQLFSLLLLTLLLYLNKLFSFLFLSLLLLFDIILVDYFLWIPLFYFIFPFLALIPRYFLVFFPFLLFFSFLFALSQGSFLLFFSFAVPVLASSLFLSPPRCVLNVSSLLLRSPCFFSCYCHLSCSVLLFLTLAVSLTPFLFYFSLSITFSSFSSRCLFIILCFRVSPLCLCFVSSLCCFSHISLLSSFCITVPCLSFLRSLAFILPLFSSLLIFFLSLCRLSCVFNSSSALVLFVLSFLSFVWLPFRTILWLLPSLVFCYVPLLLSSFLLSLSCFFLFSMMLPYFSLFFIPLFLALSFSCHPFFVFPLSLTCCVLSLLHIVFSLPSCLSLCLLFFDTLSLVLSLFLAPYLLLTSCLLSSFMLSLRHSFSLSQFPFSASLFCIPY